MKTAHQLARELLAGPDLPIYHFDPSMAGTDEEMDTSVSVPSIQPGGERNEFLTICGEGTDEDEAVSASEMDLRIKLRDGVLFTREELTVINKQALELCHAIERLPASEEATALSIKASAVQHPINRKLWPIQ